MVPEERMTSAHGTHAHHQPTPTGRTGSPAHPGRPDAHGDHGADAAHDRHAGHSVEMFRRKFWGTLLLSLPTVVWSPMVQHWLGYEAWGGATASRVIPAVFGTLVFAYGGWVFVRGARERGANVVCHDPLVTRWPELDMPVATEIPSLDGVDALIFAVPHREYEALDFPSWLNGFRPVVLDANAVLSDAQRKVLREMGCRVGSIGRGATA